MFSNPTVQSTFNQLNGNSFGGLYGFEMYSILNIFFYYVMDWGANKVFILNDQCSFIASKSFYYPSYMISMDNSLYMTGISNVWKLDQDLNVLMQYNPGGTPWYNGISYNPSNGLIYVAPWFLNEIQVFNLDLNLIRRISISPH